MWRAEQRGGRVNARRGGAGKKFGNAKRWGSPEKNNSYSDYHGAGSNREKLQKLKDI